MEGLTRLAVSNMEAVLHEVPSFVVPKTIEKLLRDGDEKIRSFVARWMINDASGLSEYALNEEIKVSLRSLHHYLDTYIEVKVAEKMEAAAIAQGASNEQQIVLV